MKDESKIIYVAILTNFILSGFQIVFGVLGNSKAVVADGIHTFGYLLTNFIAVLGDKISRKPANSKHPFGYGRIQYVTSILMGFLVIIIGVLLILNIITVQVLTPNLYVLTVIAFVIFCKQILARYLFRKSHETENMIIEAISKETHSDVLSSIVVLFLVSITYFADKNYYLSYADTLGAVVIALFIMKTGLDIIVENIGDIVGEKEECKERLKLVRETILKEKKVVEIKTLAILKYGPYSKLYLEIKMEGRLTLNVINRRIKNLKHEIKKVDRKIKYININVIPK